MKRLIIANLLLTLLAAGCQPQVFYVEVTPAAGAAPVATAAPAVAATVEVTRLVPQEVTRIVTQVITAEVPITATPVPPGSEARPVQLLFPPRFPSAVIAARGQALAEWLSAHTGFRFTVGMLDDEATVISLLCRAPADTIGFLSAAGFVLAQDQCGAQAGGVAVHADGLSWQTGMLVTRRDSGIQSLADVAGQRWGVPDQSSLPDFLAFQAQLQAAGVPAPEVVPLPGANSALLALLDGEVDFITATYVPPILPFEERAWAYGQDDPEVWRRLGLSPTRSPIGYVLVLAEPEFGGYRLRDARAGIFDTRPTVFDETRIMALSPQIPNEAVTLGPDFPLALARTAMDALVALGGDGACAESLCAGDFYGWTAVSEVEAAAYAPVRQVLETLDLDAAVLGEQTP